MKHWTVMILLAGMYCVAPVRAQERRTEARLDAVRGIVAAVNARDADAYVAQFAEDVTVRLYDGEVRVRGRQAMRENRRLHFERYPHVRNELLHLVAIDNRVVMHDRAWLDRRTSRPLDVVEIYTFDADDRIVRVDVLQPQNALTGGRADTQAHGRTR